MVVPEAVVCQYQVSPPGALPVAVKVTPGDVHCGELLVGAGGFAGNESTVNVPGLVAVPPPVVTVTLPVVPEPITAIICVDVKDVMDVTAVPPIFTLAAVIPMKLVPLMVMVDPVHPLAVPKLVIVGVGGTTTVNV